MNKPRRLSTTAKGRIKHSKTLSGTEKEVFTDAASLISEIKSRNSSKLALEIGFGMGDFILENAKLNPDMLYVGCEMFEHGVVKVQESAQKEKLNNLLLFHGDARDLIEASVLEYDKIFVLFPDPWPKRKHFKRRIVTIELLSKLSSLLKSDGEIIIATDITSYQLWISGQINQLLLEKNSPIEWKMKNIKSLMDNSLLEVNTKYSRKALSNNRKNAIFVLSKRI